MLEIHAGDKVLGTITLTADGLAGSTPAMQEMADQSVRNSGGDTELAYRKLARMNNGYSWAVQT
jgi:hypothetical protein